MASSVPDTSFLEELSDNFLQCPIHLDRFDKPKMLPCLHSVCLSCLEQWQQQSGSTDEVTCPQCRKLSDVPPGGIQSLPDNFLINSLLDYVDQQSGEGDDDSTRKCDICATNSPDSEVVRCADCSMFLCGSCTASHKKIPSTANHQLIPMAEFAGMGIAEKLNLTSPMCPKHPTARLEFFCTKCKVPICTQCTVVAHKAPVHKIQELSEAYAKLRKQLEGELKGNQKKHTKLQQAIADTTTNIVELENQRDVAYETAQQQADKVIDLVSQYLAEIEEQIEQEFTDQKDSLDRRLEDLLQLDEDFKHTQEFGSRILQFGNQVTLSSVGPDIMRKVNNLKAAYQDADEGKLTADLGFTVNEEFTEDQLCCDSIGYVECMTEESPEESSTLQEDEIQDDTVPSTPTETDMTDEADLEGFGVPAPEQTIIKRTYKGRSYPGKRLHLLVLVRDCLGNPVQIDDTSIFQYQMKMPAVDEETRAALDKLGQSAATVTIGKNKDGTVALNFLSNVSGVFTLLVTMNGKPVKSYPYSVQVFPDAKQETSLTGAFGEMRIEDREKSGSDAGGGYENPSSETANAQVLWSIRQKQAAQRARSYGTVLTCSSTPVPLMSQRTVPTHNRPSGNRPTSSHRGGGGGHNRPSSSGGDRGSRGGRSGGTKDGTGTRGGRGGSRGGDRGGGRGGGRSGSREGSRDGSRGGRGSGKGEKGGGGAGRGSSTDRGRGGGHDGSRGGRGKNVSRGGKSAPRK